MAEKEIILSLKNIHKAFGQNKVLVNLSFDLYEGEILALFGGSGSGKSVILRSIIGLEKPNKGEILFEGKNIVLLNEKQLIEVRTKIGYVFQNGALFDSMSVEANLAYPLEEHTTLTDVQIQKRIEEMLDLIGLKGSEKLFPANLSGGMQKRLGVARAIIIHPEIILYDEPTAGLDPYNTQRLLELMKQIQQTEKKTAIFVTHDIPSAFEVADRVAILYNGSIHVVDTVERIKNSKDPLVKAFLSGEKMAEGKR